MNYCGVCISHLDFSLVTSSTTTKAIDMVATTPKIKAIISNILSPPIVDYWICIAENAEKFPAPRAKHLKRNVLVIPIFMLVRS